MSGLMVFPNNGRRWVSKAFGLLVLLCVWLGLVVGVSAQAEMGSVPATAARHTWVLGSAGEFQPAEPPDAQATAAEIEELRALAAERDDEALLQIAYWNSGPPAYRWNQIALDAMLERALPAPPALRDLALLHAAISDATVAAYEGKATYARPRPNEVDPTLSTVIPNPTSPSYPSDYAVTAAAASTVLSWLFPEDAQMFEAKASEAMQSRLLAGVEYPSDIEAGMELGRQVAERAIERGMADGSADPWTGSVPTEMGRWTGENPGAAQAATWQTWVLTSPDQFRPAAPPAYDSEQLAAEMDELRTFERTPVTNAIGLFWEYGAGGRHIHWFWNDVADRLVLEARLENDPVRAAQAYALVNVAGYDAMVGCWDAKFAYWAIRPFQLDPEFAPVFTTPNHPSYPSAHACISTAMTSVLAELFPASAAEVLDWGREASESRIWSGLHFRSDVEAGEALGVNVANAVLAHASSDGS